MPEPRVSDEVRAIIAKELACSMEEIRDDDGMSSLSGLDSLKLFRIVAALEEKFQISMEDGQLYDVRSVADLVSLVEEDSSET
jgi:acyl carrier protein